MSNDSTLVKPRTSTFPTGATLQVYLPEATFELQLEVGQPITLGRGDASDLALEDPSVSRKHAVVFWRNNGLWIEDLGSRNGVFVNGNEVDRARITSGDQVEVGDVRIGVAGASRFSPATLVAYDQWIESVERRVSASQREPFSLGMIRALGPSRHLAVWVNVFAGRLSPGIEIASYGTEAVVMLAALDLDRVVSEIIESATGRGAGLEGATVRFPSDGTHTHELLGTLTGAARPSRRAGPRAATRSSPALIAESDAMREVLERVERFAPRDTHVLVLGETGTGKEVITDLLHQWSPRADGPLRKINCGAIQPALLASTLFGHEKGAFTGADRSHPGVFEQCDGGTLVLDEVGELDAKAQAALLRVLETKTVTRVGGVEEKRVDVRIVASTHRDLAAMAAHGEFRLDLLHRLRRLVVKLPPLRERGEDVLLLAEQFLQDASKAHARPVRGLSAAAVEELRARRWPGNVRELRNVIERALLLARGDVVQALGSRESRPPPPPAPSVEQSPAGATMDGVPFKERVRAYERELMVRALEEAKGNKTVAARTLKMPLRTFMSKCASYAIGSD